MDKEWERQGHLSPEEKVQLRIDMTDGCMWVCVDGIRPQYPGISEEALLENLRELIQRAKTH